MRVCILLALFCHLQSCLLDSFLAGNNYVTATNGARSEDVTTLAANVASVIESRWVHHGLAVSNALPDVGCDVFTVLNRILVHFLNVLLLASTVSVPDALIVSLMQWVSLLEWSENRRLLFSILLFREGNVSAIGREARIEAASLAYSIWPGLVTVDDFAVQSGIFVATIILFMLVSIFCVA